MGTFIMVSFNLRKILSLYIYKGIYFLAFLLVLSFEDNLNIALWITDNTR